MTAGLNIDMKNGKELISFFIGDPAEFQQGRNWNPVQMKKKTPSQLKRNQRRKKEFIEKKKETSLLKEKSEMETAALITPVDATTNHG